jgi:F-type H+-transporting ATPase subunit delta
MAELATLARPYAEALFKSISANDYVSVSEQADLLALLAADEGLRAFADNPRTTVDQVFGVITAAAKTPLGGRLQNLLRVVIENGRLAALPEIAAQFKTLMNAQAGSSDATVYSAFAIDAAALADVVAALEKRYARKLNATVVVEPELIGGIRVVVGDEVLDTSVKARLEQMKSALTA